MYIACIKRQSKKFWTGRFIVSVLLLALLLFQSKTITARQQYNPVPVFSKSIATSPEVASLGKYGDIPVGYYTGTANISVPLYTLEESGFKIPLTLSYHSSGIKVEEQAAYVGLGWSFEPGGYITQVINGVNDDVDNLPTFDPSGYTFLRQGIANSIYNERAEIGSLWPCLSIVQTPTAIDRSEVIGKVKTGYGQPDIFHFSFGGYSGSFYKHPENGNIVIINKTAEIQFERVNTYTWRATILDGTKFEFSAREFSYLQTDPGVPSSITWKLTSIQLTNGRSIQFEYIDGYYEWFKYVESYHTAYPHGLSTSQFDAQKLQTEYNIKYLHRIRTLDKVINFNYEDRIDLKGVADLDGIAGNGSSSIKRLRSVDIRNLDGPDTLALSEYKLEKSFEFSYDYFGYTSSGNSFQPGTTFNMDQLGKRLKLLSVREAGYDKAGGKKYYPPHEFEYIEDNALPLKTSFAVDFWGYYNGKTGNAKLIPDLRYYYYSSYSEYAGIPFYLISQIQGGNRSANENLSKSGLLKKIKYPTQGYTEFDYEANTFTNYAYPDIDQIESSKVNIDLEDKNVTGNTTNHTFPLAQETVIEFSNMINRGPNMSLTFDDLLSASITVRKIVNSTITILKTWQMQNTQAYRDDFNADGFVSWNETLTIPYDANAQYAVTVYLPDALGPQNTSNNSASVRSVFYYYNASPGSYGVYKGAGLRIKSIKNYTGLSKLASHVKLEYLNTDNSSSGLLMTPLKHFYSQDMHFVKFNGWFVGPNDNPLYPLIVYGGGTAWFANSETLFPMSSTALSNHVGYSRVVEKRLDGTGNGNGKTVMEYINTAHQFKINNPSIPNVSNGLLSKETVFREGDNAKIQEVTYLYTSLAQSAFAGVKVFSKFAGAVPCDYSSGGQPVADYGDYMNNKMYRIHFYPILSVWNVLASKTTKVYNGTDVLTNGEEYGYNTYGQVISIISDDSRGRETKTETTYPIDVISSPNTTETQIIAKKRFDLPLLTKEYVSSNLVRQARYKYYTTGDIQPEKVEVSTNGIDFHSTSRFTQYDASSFPKEFEENGVANALIWSRHNRIAVATVAGARVNQIAYSSFENKEILWTVQANAIQENSNAVTGSKVYNLSVASITTPVLPQGEYIISYWRPNGAGAISITGTIEGYPQIQKTANGWQYIEHRVRNFSSAGLTGTGLIDEIRIYPVGAQMNTRVVDHFGRIVSACSSTSMVTHYRYDHFGRLILVTNESGQIIRRICYNLSGEAEDCGAE